jgi:hypothetical protein
MVGLRIKRYQSSSSAKMVQIAKLWKPAKTFDQLEGN